ncbi:conserved hypothetical protein [Neospora caninum Liverpool]|uniref:COPI associated protein n=1 Tax=Neospora caninum (strain Liverpool) TaxID=572307 RepID=F0VAV4_NEOCL|nr:conserved hypothetical protein [Neospora caninum Liverpool]CBZ50812.1 conserved hypothetical protein [Neospora caninum Liverpool]CEL68113.1 TPA: hypothetical protein BN1204_038870 [Neospora caninum Liverpool]|eukprot:XP_003880845.1 conserved hypothetical protein [Neospora caninum Liverpool]
MDPYLASSSYAAYCEAGQAEAAGRGGRGQRRREQGEPRPLDFSANAFLASQALRFVQAESHGAPHAAPESQFGVEEAGARFTRAALEGTMRVGSRVGTALLQEGGKILERTNLVGEGPKPLRALCFVGGVGLIAVTVLQIMNIFSMVGNPASYILQFFLMMFGVAICVVEAKDLEQLERLQPFFATWFKFLTVPLGKGLFYILVGAICLSLWTSNFFLLFVGGYMVLMGIMCVMIHFGLRHQLQRNGIDVSDDEEDSQRVRVGEQIGANQIQQALYNPAPY